MDIELAQALEENTKLKTELKTAYRKGEGIFKQSLIND